MSWDDHEPEYYAKFQKFVTAPKKKEESADFKAGFEAGKQEESKETMETLKDILSEPYNEVIVTRLQYWLENLSK